MSFFRRQSCGVWYLWTGGSLSSQDNWQEICGDGIRINKRDIYWDDGNLINGDGWNSSCNVELRYIVYHSWNNKYLNNINFLWLSISIIMKNYT